VGDATATILVIEDDPTVRALMIAILSRAHREVVVVDSAEAALDWIAADGPADLYLVDKNLPGMSGVQLIEEIRKTDKISGIVMVTGYASAESAFRSLNLGVDGYLEKPFDVEVIEQQVASALERRARRSDLRPAGLSQQELRSTLEKARADLRAVHESSAVRQAAVDFLIASPLDEEQRRMRRLLEAGGDEVDVVISARACQDRLIEEAFDVVILDTALRDPDVVEVARAVHVHRATPMCIVVGERPEVDALRQLIDLDVKAVVERHDVAEQLRSRVDALITGLRMRKVTAG
jgi:DNA-binding NtrC family response regulator